MQVWEVERNLEVSFTEQRKQPKTVLAGPGNEVRYSGN